MEKKFREKALDQALEDHDSTKARILLSAEKLFAEKGFSGTTTRDISEAAGVNTSMLHYHWGSKEELWNAVIYDITTKAQELISEMSIEPSKSTSLESLEHLIHSFFNFIADNPNIAILLQKPWFRRWGEEGAVPIVDDISRFLEKNDLLDFSPFDTRFVVFLLVGVFEFFFFRPELLHHFFDEDPTNLSQEFRNKACSAITILVKRMAGVK